jgi:hypothetical protein
MASWSTCSFAFCGSVGIAAFLCLYAAAWLLSSRQIVSISAYRVPTHGFDGGKALLPSAAGRYDSPSAVCCLVQENACDLVTLH